MDSNAKKPRIVTLDSIRTRDDNSHNLFVGGHSGLEVHGSDVNDLVTEIGQKAMRRPPEEPTDSVVERTVTFWRNGFTIDSGTLRSYSDPENKKLLEAIKNGYAPMKELGVQSGQQVDLKIVTKTDQDHGEVMHRSFAGTGNVIGAPDPAARQESNVPSLRSSADSNPLVQIRLLNGARLIQRFGLEDSISTLRRFIIENDPDSASIRFVLQTIYPTRILDDKDTVASAGIANSIVFQRTCGQ